MVEQLLSMPEALGSILSTDKHTNKQATNTGAILGVVACICNHSTWKAAIGRLLRV